ncbi:hypothetical protein [Micromonospora tarensis]|uniref:DUF4238 domain-containing protein n=1 Tax=Micromonospora tarensis TaxID=2806100 RepID=A0ABS1YA61_9ACTN|nr:hypothetical protein [Micromonospora tarensis]MBM0274284.1 hypothetical protein [Micromonospora tarensis]
MTSYKAGRVSEVNDASTMRRFVASAPDSNCVDGVFDACLRPIVYSRHHWLLFKGEYRVRAELRAVYESCRQRPPEEWDDDEADLILALFALDMSSVGLDELREHASSAAVRSTLLERHALYAGVLEPTEVPPDGLLDLARRLAEMRPLVERSHVPYSVIDGRAWYRTEGLIRRDDLDVSELAAPVSDVLDSLFDSPGDGLGASERLVATTRAAVAADGDSAVVVRAIMYAALLDPVLRADHVTLTCPVGDMLDKPAEMTTSAAFFTETQVRDGVDLGNYAERLGHESVDQMQRTIRARMLKLKRGAIRGLYGPGCMQGRFVEKHGGHMLFLNEDAHYRGHQSIGCHSGGRASFALRYRAGQEEQALTPMVGDFRVVRMSQDESDIFTVEELRHTIRYGEWIRTVVEETYRLGAVVRLDDPTLTRTAVPA